MSGVDLEAGDDVEALTQQTGRTRIEVSGPAGRQRVTAGLGLGLAVAAAARAPIRVLSPVMDALAELMPGGDALAAFAGRLPPAGVTGEPEGA